MSNYSRAHICQCLTRILTFRPKSTLTISNQRRKTGDQFVGHVLNLAHHLSVLGLRPGHIVAICAFNSDWYLEWLLAVAYVGGILAPLNYRWCLEELKLALEIIEPVVIVTDDSCKWLSELKDGSLFTPRWHLSVDSFSTSTNNVKNEWSIVACDMSLSVKYCWAPEDVALICFTSGTTGTPKGVTISHTALVIQSLAKLAIVGYSEDDVYLHTAPLCHIGGISSALAMLMAGGCHVLLPKFEPKLAVQAIEAEDVTSFITVPAMMSDLISTIRGKESSKCGRSLKKILNGGGSLSTHLVEEAIKIFSGAKLLSAYGMTETSSSITFITLYDPDTKSSHQLLDKVVNDMSCSAQSIVGNCVGKPAPHVEIMVVNEDFSSIGRIMTRGPQVMIQYWGQNTTMVSIYDENWFDTGDIGKIDVNGNLWLVGRRNGRIKSGGENVYPEEVEVVVSRHPGVVAVVVVGLPHERLGEMVVACIQVKENWIWTERSGSESLSNTKWNLSSELLKQHCQKHSLTRFKIPKVFMVWRKPFPVTSTGKLKRNQVQMEAMLNVRPLISNL